MTTNWTIDNAHSVIGFKVRHMMISNVTGTYHLIISADGLNSTKKIVKNYSIIFIKTKKKSSIFNYFHDLFFN